jgi:hypothetical protein
MRAPFLVAEIAVRRARRENEMIVIDLAAVNHDRAPRRVDARHGPPQHADGATVAKKSPDRKGDIGRRQSSGRDLIEQRLEQMIVVAVDQRDVDGFVFQAGRASHAAEPGADDDDARTFARPDHRSLEKSAQSGVKRPASGTGEGEQQKQQGRVIERGAHRHRRPGASNREPPADERRHQAKRKQDGGYPGPDPGQRRERLDREPAWRTDADERQRQPKPQGGLERRPQPFRRSFGKIRRPIGERQRAVAKAPGDGGVNRNRAGAEDNVPRKQRSPHQIGVRHAVGELRR